MRVLVFGGAGMLGHRLWMDLRANNDVWATFREKRVSDLPCPLCYGDDKRFVMNCDVTSDAVLEDCLRAVRPDVVVNAVGVVKQRQAVGEPVQCIELNALFPHRLARLCMSGGVRLIHISTDCVFSGRQGGYRESDQPDPADLYGRSKLLGEVVGTGCLTIRTSLVGWELRNRAGLFEWFASQRGTEVQGYRAAVFSGLLTTVVADVLDRAVLPNPSLCGLRHVAARPISKYDLLTQLRDRLDWRDITIDANTTFACDRSLDGTLFDAETGWRTPDWSEMVETAAMEWREYSEWRTP